MFSFQKKKSKRKAKKKVDEAPGPVQLSKVCSPSNRWPFAEKNAVPFKNEPENLIFMILFWLLIYSDSTPCSQGNSLFPVVRFQEGVLIAIDRSPSPWAPAIEDFAHEDSSSGFTRILHENIHATRVVKSYTELIMWIGHRQEIWKPTFQALDLRWSEWILIL